MTKFINVRGHRFNIDHIKSYYGVPGTNETYVEIGKKECLYRFPPEEMDKAIVELEKPKKPEYDEPGLFTVNAFGKKVRFASGNLFWDGDKFAFEEHQYDFPKEWDPKHVGHFFWSEHAIDAASLNYDDSNSRERLFFAADGEAVKGYTILSEEEWRYLFEHSIGKHKVTIAGVDCLILAPDGFEIKSFSNFDDEPGKIKGVILDTYTADDWEEFGISLGLVALPYTGFRSGENLYDAGDYGKYWTSTLHLREEAFSAYVSSDDADTWGVRRNYGQSVRLVKVQ